MKIILSVAFDGDRATFVDAMLPLLESIVATGEASKATLDARAADADIEPFGSDLMRPLEVNAVVALWDAEPDGAIKLELPAIARLVGGYHVDEVVQKDYERTWPSGTESPGIKMIAFLHRRGDLTHDQFSQHWRDNHGPLAVARQPGFWHYVQNHVVERLTDDTPDWDGVGEIHCRSVEDALHRSYDSEEAQKLIWEDVARFLDYETSPTLVTNEWTVDQRQ